MSGITDPRDDTTEHTHAAVVVVGLGPAGAVLAALLGAEGVDVLVLEAEREVTPYPRAIAADGETTWFEGLMLVGVYGLLTLGFFFVEG